MHCLAMEQHGVQNEVKLLLELLPKYHAHVERYPHTLLIKFYGLHRVVPLNGSKVRSRPCTVLLGEVGLFKAMSSVRTASHRVQ